MIRNKAQYIFNQPTNAGNLLAMEANDQLTIVQGLAIRVSRLDWPHSICNPMAWFMLLVAYRSLCYTKKLFCIYRQKYILFGILVENIGAY